tara:strand:- start:1513 stop:3948 length:2436 start_codon:yes stop_codon:yes gene_type:complete
MAHGYLSANDLRGKSGIEKALEKYLSDRFDDLKKQIKEGFRKTDLKVEEVAVRDLGRNLLPQGQQGLLSGSNRKELTGAAPALLAGSKYAEIASARAPKGLLSAEKAIDVEVMGMNPVVGENPIARLPSSDYAGTRGPIDANFVNLGIEKDLPGSDNNFLATSAGPAAGADQIVQSIDRLTMVTTMLVAATKEQTQQQGMIASAQMQQSEKLARQAKASAEEAALEQGGDFSGNSAYALLGAGAAGGGRAGFGGGGGPGFGLGGKVLAKNMLGAATKRGAARTGTRLGAALGGKMLGGFGARMGAKLGSKSIGKIAGKGIAKSLGKKIPLVGLGLGAIFAAQRAMKGDFVGAGLELASGAASTVPGIGTAGSVGIDAALMARDMGATPFAEGGIITEPTTGLIGEAGKEGVFPLEGTRGKKTFAKFGEGVLEAQLRNKTKVVKLQAEGLAEFYQKKPWWEKLIDGLKKLLPGWLGGDGGGNSDSNGGQWWNPFSWGRTGNNGDGKGKTDGVTPKSTMLPAKQDAVSGSYDSFLGGRPAFTSGFGLRNTGIQGASTDHKGIDIGVDAGAEVKAIESGKVVDIYKDFGGWGDGLVIQHADGSKNVYGHIESSVGIGDEVKAGDKVGLIKYWPSEHYPQGRQHLHLERIEGGTKVDPQTYLNNLMSADQADVDGDVEKIKKNPQVEALTALMGASRKKGKVEVAGVGSFARTNPRGGKFESFYRDTEGKQISKDEFMSRLRSAQADPSSALNKASTEVASGDRAAANGSSTPAIVPLETGGKPQSTQPSAPAPAPASGDILPSTLRAVQVATAQ